MLALLTSIPAPALRAQANPNASSGSSEEPVILSQFQVTTTADKGYRASNSVTGSRFDTPIKDLPIALQAFTAEFINDIHPETLYDIALYSPGVSYRSSDFTNGNAELAIRGFNIAAGGLYSAQSLRDGLKGPPIMEFSNVERVEIVKGPASFLYGQVAPGGMVNMITKAPKEKFQGSTTGSIGSYGEYRGLVDVTGPVGGGLFYRVGYSYSHDMSYWKPYDSNQWDLAPQLLYKLNDQASLAVKFEHFEKNESPQLFQKPQWSYTRSGLPSWASGQADPLVANPVIPAGLPSWTVGGNDPNLSGVVVAGLPRTFNQMADTDYRNSRDNSLATILDVKANEHWSIRATYAFDKNVIDMIFSGRPVGNPNINAYTASYNAAIGAGLSAAQAAAAGFPSSGYAQPRRFRWQTTSRVSDSVEGQALGDYKLGDISLKLLAGAQYNPYSARQKNGQAPDSTTPAYNPSGPLPPWDLRDPSTWNRSVPSTLTKSNVSLTGSGTPAINNDITRVTDTAFYGGTTWGFFKDRFLVLAAIRRTESALQTEHDFNTAIVPGIVSRTVDPQFKSAANTPQIGVLYKVRPDVSAFASYSESFVPAAGTLTVIDKTNPLVWNAVAGDPIQPTKGKGYDLGVKTDLLDGRISSTVTYFDVKNQNIVVSIPQTGPNGIFFPTFQSGLQESKGIEADLTYSPIDNWQVYVSASMMNARTVTVSTASEDARLLAVNTYVGYLALSSADQNLWRNVWRFHDRPLQMTSPHSYNLWTKYTFPGALKGLFIGGGANIIRDQTIFQDTEDRYHQNLVLVNAIAGYSTKFGAYPVTFTLNGKNLTDKEYLPSQNTQSRPREFVFSVTVKF